MTGSFTDESLRWLTANGEVKEAERILVKAAAMNRVKESEVLAKFRRVRVLNTAQRQSEICKSSDKQKSIDGMALETKSTVTDSFINRTMLLRAAINALLW